MTVTCRLWNNKFILAKITHFPHYCILFLHAPLKNEATELDVLILNLCKILIDYLNVKSINTFLTSEQKDLRSIEKLEVFLEMHSFKSYEDIITFYKTLQKLRSIGSAHRKNSDYKKLLAKLGFENLDEKGIFKALLNDAINILKNLSMQVEFQN